MIDTHCHIHDKQFDDDRDAVVLRAREAGVEMLTVGCDAADSARAVEAAERYGLYASVGIHPHETKDAPADLRAWLQSASAHPRVIAVGEIGLDYHYDHSPREVQRRALAEQLAFACERRMPVIFHQREAMDDFLAILREQWTPAMRGVIHCFTGDERAARTFAGEFGLMLGIGGVLTFKTAEPLREAVRAVGLDAIVLETDCPYLAPVPLRGRRNEPAFVTYAANKLADVLGAGLDNVVAATDRNAAALFGKR